MAEKDIKSGDAKNEVVLNDDQIICSLTNQIKKSTEKELTLQHMISMMIEEYGFSASDLERDFNVSFEDDEKKRKQKVDLAVFEEGKPHSTDTLIRFIVIAKDSKVKTDDTKAGVTATLENILSYTDCEFGCWTNGIDMQFQHSLEDDFGQVTCEDLSDWPAKGQTLEELEQAGERAPQRTPANESLVRTFKRCHNYLYGNEGRKKDAFWELLNLIFCKLYDEKRRFIDAKNRVSYRRRFWVGVKEMNTPEGQAAVTERIKSLFEELKTDDLYKDVFDGNERISISDAGVTYIASELAKYSFLNATVDIKGTAYETIVSNTLKQEAGQFFTPRNIVKCMVEMLDPGPDTRVLDPACGSGGFLVGALDHVRRKIARNLYPELDDVRLDAKLNTPEVDQMVSDYAGRMIFGFDFDPDLRKASRMNMVMAGDGHANIFNINSLDYPDGQLPDVPLVAPAVAKSIETSYDHDFPFETAMDNARGKFDMIFTNPPFGANVEVASSIAAKYSLTSIAGSSPEVLFLEACYKFLKPGGKMAIVVPDSILGNPSMEDLRKWILQNFKLLASVDLPVETFKPQVGVQASLLFLQKKTAMERLKPLEKEDYDVFMAIAEKVGKDLRGVPIYKRDEDGAEMLFEHEHRWLSYEPNGSEKICSRHERIKHLDDDLPEIAKAYRTFLNDLKQTDL
jgi:type I restriction enzyme M protein